MSVVLEAIKFNHDPSSSSRDGLNIRRNASQFVTVPEWRRGISVRPEDSPVAYAIAAVAGNTITIQAAFSTTNPRMGTVRVRAIDSDANPPDKEGCLGWLLYFLFLLVQAIAGNVLGAVKERSVTFAAAGDTGFLTFDLTNVRLARAGVGVRTTTWRWQYRRKKGEPWTDFATSTHRVYSVLEVPKAPWQQAPYDSGNVQLPWAEVLDYACSWAVLTTTRDDAAAAVTRRIYDLGPEVITYDCPGGGSTHYALGSFDCTAFLERLRGGTGNGWYVNCTDCATFVSTFANVLGCDLWQSRMGWFFQLNALLGIGSGIWEPACVSEGWSGSFSYHEVAWKGACTAEEEIFDACLQVDGDADPTSAPHTPLLPTALRFGNPGDGDYRDRLATPAGRPNCNPDPMTRVRRAVV